MKKLFLIVPISIIILSNNALAYIDPSTGGILFNTIWPLIVAFFVFIGAFITRWFWKPLKRGFSKIFTKN